MKGQSTRECRARVIMEHRAQPNIAQQGADKIRARPTNTGERFEKSSGLQKTAGRNISRCRTGPGQYRPKPGTARLTISGGLPRQTLCPHEILGSCISRPGDRRPYLWHRARPSTSQRPDLRCHGLRCALQYWLLGSGDPQSKYPKPSGPPQECKGGTYLGHSVGPFISGQT